MRCCQDGCTRGRTALKLLTCLVALCWAPVSLADVELKFGVYASDKPTVVVKKFHPMLSALEGMLSERLGQQVSIKLQVASSYQIGIEAAASG